MKKDNSMNYLLEIKTILAQARQKAYYAINSAMVEAYWNIGRLIVEEEQHGTDRAAYGKQIIQTISEELTAEFGKGFSKRTIWEIRQFYITFPEYEIMRTLSAQLSWSHFQQVLKVSNENARMYDDLKRQADDNPTIGLLLCTETDSVVAKYSVLNDNKQLFSSKYIHYLPTEEELIREIEQQKLFFEMQRKDNNNG